MSEEKNDKPGWAKDNTLPREFKLRDNLPTYRELADENSQLKARISECQKELGEVYEAGAPMAANQCLHGIRGDDGGNSYCPEIERLKARIAELESVYKTILFNMRLQVKLDSPCNDAIFAIDDMICKSINAALNTKTK